MSPPESQVEAVLLRDRALRTLARGLLADVHAAEDVAQEAWLVALQRGEGALSLSRWLAGVVRNLALKRRRGEQRRTLRERDSARPEATPSAEEILEREAARARVVAAVLALEEPYRETVVLRHFENLPPRAIARRQGVPVETVRTRQKRALESLRARLDGEFGGERRAWCALLAPFAGGTGGSLLGRIVESLPTALTVAVMSTQAKLAGGAVAAALIAVWFVGGRRTPVLSGADEPAPAAKVALQAPPPEEEAGLVAASGAVPERAPASVSATPAEAPGAEVGSVRVRVSWFDESPAEAIRVFVQPNWGQGGATLRDREGLTDASGEVVIGGIAPGAAFVQLDRGTVDVAAVAQVTAGVEAQAELVLPRGFDVRGVVLDPLGAPVAGADVWVSRYFGLEEGFVLARTDSRGRFELRSLAQGHIGARAPGFAPSLCQSLYAGEGAELEVELVLMGPGGAVAGTVLDPAGEPLPGAWVAVGLDHPLGQVHMLPVGGREKVRGLLPGPIETRTDEHGHYRIEGVAPGKRRMAVRAERLGAWRGEVEVVEERTRTQDVQLQPGVSLEGRVLRADGTPARASIEIGEPVGMLGSATDTDAQGRFRLDGLEAGELEVRASGVSASGRDGRARVTLHGAPGETLTWEAHLVTGGAIRGRVVDENGEPLAGWLLQSQDDPSVRGDSDFAAAETDAEGRFVLEDQHDRPHRVEVRPPDHAGFPVAVAHRIHPGREELVLRVRADQLPTVFVAGTVVDELGRPVDGAQLALGRADQRARLFLPDPSGHFEVGPVSPGTWTLRVTSPELPALPAVVLGPRALVPDETWDCGTIVLGQGGTLLVAPRGLGAEAEPSFAVLRADGFQGPLRQDGEGWRSGPLQSGEYLLQVRGRAVAAVRLPFEIRAGEVTRLEPALAAGQTIEIRVLAPDAGESTRLDLRIRDARGTEVLTDRPWLRPDAEGIVHAGDFGTEVALAPGVYEVEAWLEDGRRETAQLRVAEGEARLLVLELR